MSFDELGEAVRTANADTSTEAEQRQAADTGKEYGTFDMNEYL